MIASDYPIRLIPRHRVSQFVHCRAMSQPIYFGADLISVVHRPSNRLRSAEDPYFAKS